MIMNSENLEFIEIVYDDLLHVQQEARAGCSDHQLRRISVFLRKLLLEQDLLKAWKLLDMPEQQPSIVASKMMGSKFRDPNDISIIGGAETESGTVFNFLFTPRLLSDDGNRQLDAEMENFREYSFKLSDFIKSDAIFLKAK